MQIVSAGGVDWEKLGKNGIRRRLLHRDAHGAETMVIEIPRGWKGGGIAHYHSAFEEVFVIDGDVTLNGRDDLLRNSYVYRPARVVHGHAESAREGAFAIVRNGGVLDMNFVPEPLQNVEYPLGAIEDGRGLIVHLASADVRAKPLAPGVFEKPLSYDHRTKAETSLVSIEAGRTWRTQHETAMNLLVIEGALSLGGRRVVAVTHIALDPLETVLLETETNARLLAWRG